MMSAHPTAPERLTMSVIDTTLETPGKILLVPVEGQQPFHLEAEFSPLCMSGECEAAGAHQVYTQVPDPGQLALEVLIGMVCTEHYDTMWPDTEGTPS